MPSAAPFLILCEYAAVNADGSFTVIRGGLDDWAVEKLPLKATAWLFFEMARNELSVGEHEVLITLTNPQNVKIWDQEGKFAVHNSESVSRGAVPIPVNTPVYGVHRVDFRVEEASASASFNVRPRK